MQSLERVDVNDDYEDVEGVLPHGDLKELFLDEPDDENVEDVLQDFLVPARPQ